MITPDAIISKGGVFVISLCVTLDNSEKDYISTRSFVSYLLRREVLRMLWNSMMNDG